MFLDFLCPEYLWQWLFRWRVSLDFSKGLIDRREVSAKLLLDQPTSIKCLCISVKPSLREKGIEKKEIAR
jgi:hypothetical protein